ncbi:hypothetical protein LSTR_LSTR008132 [Laodelphax striatellus]|uniref:Uncharacterized protein n=1 Tax=Laodelphax striatellus TaxID=195883 RepID=A0A482XS05_LAOST|nr:hypothetical protein LSTR_LSTR008132 [Laodelphax striatellus]
MMWGSSFNAMLIFEAILLTSIGILQVDTTSTDGTESASPEPLPESLVYNELYHTYFTTVLHSTLLVPKTVVIKLLDATLNQPEIKGLLTMNTLIQSEELCACLSYLLVSEATLFNHFSEYPNHNTVFKTAIQLWKDHYVNYPKDYNNPTPKEIKDNVANELMTKDYNNLTPKEIRDNVANELMTTPKITSAIDWVIIESIRINKVPSQEITFELLRSAVLIKITKYMTIVSQPSKKKDILLKVSTFLEKDGIGGVYESSGLSNKDIITLRSYLVSVS